MKPTSTDITITDELPPCCYAFLWALAPGLVDRALEAIEG